MGNTISIMIHFTNVTVMGHGDNMVLGVIRVSRLTAIIARPGIMGKCRYYSH